MRPRTRLHWQIPRHGEATVRGAHRRRLGAAPRGCVSSLRRTRRTDRIVCDDRNEIPPERRRRGRCRDETPFPTGATKRERCAQAKRHDRPIGRVPTRLTSRIPNRRNRRTGLGTPGPHPGSATERRTPTGAENPSDGPKRQPEPLLVWEYRRDLPEDTATRGRAAT